jgi:Peptidase family S41
MTKRRKKRSGASAAAASTSRTGELSPADQQKLIDVALDLTETLYVHLPLKRSMYAIDPLQRLKLLRRRSELQIPPLDRREFFSELLTIFKQLRDLHTTFQLPEPFSNNLAYLPFELQRCVGNSGEEIYVVSVVKTEGEEPIDPDFHRGSIVTYWNGTHIKLVVAANAEREAGSNPAARLAQGLRALTIRWLGQSLPPDEDWVDIIFVPDIGKEPKQIRFKWKFHQPDQPTRKSPATAASTIATAEGENVWRVGMDARGEAERQARVFLFSEARKQMPRVKHFGPDADTSVAGWAQEVFPVCGNVRTPSGLFGYVRIATFNVQDDKGYIDEFVRIISQLSQDGLILDVRGNGGGLIMFGERMLQLLTPRQIDPARFSFLNSPRTKELTGKYNAFRQWRDSIAQSIETGAEYSQGFPIDKIEVYNDIGQKYQGPVVLITDALCYSTTDIFAAGFQDHEIGVILGVDETTGAGGANVWEYFQIAPLLGDTTRFPSELPAQASFRFAVRRVTRVGNNSGALLEDLGVKADKRHHMTRRDVLERNVDLIKRAAKILKKSPVHRLTAERQKPDKLRITYQNLDCIDAYLDGRPFRATLKVERSPRLKHLSIALTAKMIGSAQQLKLEGFRSTAPNRGTLVAATRLAL